MDFKRKKLQNNVEKNKQNFIIVPPRKFVEPWENYERGVAYSGNYAGGFDKTGNFSPKRNKHREVMIILFFPEK